jgi:hypothetical protein
MSNTNNMNKSLSNEEVGSEPIFQRESLVLADVLANRVTLHYFQKFLEQEYSEENLLFYLEVERFKSLKPVMALEAKALSLYRNFINPETATTPVNLTQEVVDDIQLKLAPLLLQRTTQIEDMAHPADTTDNDNDNYQYRQNLLKIFDKASEGK